LRKLLNTLFVTSDNIYLTEENENVVLKDHDTVLGTVPLHILENIFSFSYIGASPALLGKCAESGIGFAMLTPNGKFLCRVSGSSHGNVLLRKQQYRISDSEQLSLPYIKNMILGKVYNEKWTVNRTIRDHSLRVNENKLRDVSNALSAKLEDIRNSETITQLRGIEGDSAAEYFSAFDDLILNNKTDFYFHGRSRRPPLDNVNAMLSFCYTLLANDCASALESVGLDSYVGFMHTDKPGRKSFALDLMEELRAPVADRFVLSMINQKRINADSFIKSADGAVRFTDDARKEIVKEWQNRKRSEITHPYLKEKIEWGLVPYVQSLLLARCIRGDLEEYPPFLWK
jgi:CRISPR-associated protein Cas1